MITDVFLNKKRVNVCENMVRMMPSLPCVHIHLLSSDRERHLERRNISIKLSSGDLFICWYEFPLSFLILCIICTSVLSFPCGL